MERGKSRHNDFSASIPTKDWVDIRRVRINLVVLESAHAIHVPSRCIFDHLGFVIAETVTPFGVRDTSITPPDTDPSTSDGRQNGRKLLRFWVETSAWLLDYQRRYSMYSPDVLDVHSIVHR